MIIKKKVTIRLEREDLEILAQMVCELGGPDLGPDYVGIFHFLQERVVGGKGWYIGRTSNMIFTPKCNKVSKLALYDWMEIEDFEGLITKEQIEVVKILIET